MLNKLDNTNYSVPDEREWVSNYEKMKQAGQKEFLKYDQDEIIRKLSLKHDQDYIYIDFLKQEYRLERETGKIQRLYTNNTDLEWLDTDNEKNQQRNGNVNFTNVKDAGFNEAMTIFDVLCYSKAGSYPSGEFVNMQSLSAIKGSSAALGNSFFQKEELLFAENVEKLVKACEVLDGIKGNKGDVAYQIPLFDFLTFVISFWEPDDEFPPTLQIFVDKNTLQFMHYETMWYAVSHMLERIKEEMEK